MHVNIATKDSRENQIWSTMFDANIMDNILSVQSAIIVFIVNVIWIDTYRWFMIKLNHLSVEYVEWHFREKKN